MLLLEGVSLVDDSFMNCERSNERKLVYHQLEQQLRSFGYVDSYDRVFVLRLLIHKIQEGEL